MPEANSGLDEIDVSVNKLFNEEATIIVWRNINKFGFIPTGHFGHAAIMLRGSSLGLGADQYNYISWWPESAGKSDALKRQEGIAEDDYQSDMSDEMSERAQNSLSLGRYAPRRGQLRSLQGWGAASDAQVSIPGIGGHADINHPFGLCLPRMRDWWSDYQDSDGIYQLASKTKSCAGVALVAMVEGGAEGFTDGPTILTYAQPKVVESHARKLQGKILEFNARARKFRTSAKQIIDNKLNSKTGVTGFAPPNKLWAYDTWKQVSNVKRSSRSSVIKDIDKHYAKYDKLNWTTDFPKKYKHMIKMMDKVMEHNHKKPDSERNYAVARLGQQIMRVTMLLRQNPNPG